MSRTKALLWKEWLEIRVFFFIALFVFLGLPLLGGIESRIQTGRFDIMASAWTYFLGGLFAIFVGVGTVVRDMKGRLEDFWRSRPVGVSQWLVIKYLVGLVVVIATLALPLILELLVNQTESDLYTRPQLVLAWHPFMWAVLYSVGFLMACLVRRGAHAVMLSVAVMLLLYFLPEIVPPLRHLSLTWAVDESAVPRRDGAYNLLPSYHPIPWTLGKAVFQPVQLQFALGMIVLSAVALGLSLLIVRRGTHVESGRRTLYWSLGGAVLILFTSATFQVATNLHVLQTVKLGEHESVQQLRGGGEGGIVVTVEFKPMQQGNVDAPPPPPVYRVHHFKLSANGIELGGQSEMAKEFWWWRAIWQPERPDVMYSMKVAPQGPAQEHYPVLLVAQLTSPMVTITEQPFPKLLTDDTRNGATHLREIGDRLYMLYGPHVVIFDLTDPSGPKVISESVMDGPPEGFDPYLDNESTELVQFRLPQVPGLTPAQRLQVRTDYWRSFDGKVLTHIHDNRIVTFVLENLTDSTATFRRVGHYDPTPVQRLFAPTYGGAVSLNGLYYLSTDSRFDGGFRMSVFDISDPQRPHPIGHAAFPAPRFERALLPLPEGRLITAGGNQLSLISAPPKRE